MKSSDGGTIWSQQSAIGAAELAVDPENSNTLYALSYDCLGPCSAGQRSYFGIFKSMDGGASWDRLWSVANSSNPISNWGRTLAIDPQNPANIYATTQGYFDECGNEMFHKTVDGGVSWAESAFNFGWCALALVVDPQRPTILYAGFELGGVLKSTDAGATWTVANSGLPPSDQAQMSAQFWPLASSGQPLSAVVSLAIDPQNPNTLYAVAGPGGSWSILKTTDAAATWKPAGSGLPSDWSSNLDCCYRPSLAVDPQNPNNVYVGMVIAGVHRVFRSADGGASWVDSGLAVPSGSGWFGGLAVSTQNPSSVYAGTAGEGVFATKFAPEP
jgi:hypothetical protein